MNSDSEEKAEHLTPAETLEAAAAVSDPSFWQGHLSACQDCRKRVEELRDWLNQWIGRNGAPLPRTDSCLSPEAAVRPNDEELAHASLCDRCGALVKMAMCNDPLDTEELKFQDCLQSG